ncbi:MAG: histidine triad nucleotide-binding protein [Candidatus Sericytochromatia bacterium]|nr:histidine triad nucleotide-binding protein [Candidatus Sericytochromatia bacterium]
MSDCLFCRLVAGELPAQKVHEDAYTLAFRDLHPQAPTHLLVIPKRHIGGFAELTAADGPLLGHLAAAANTAAQEAGLAEGGYRVVCNQGRDAGQTVPHLHWHVLGGRPLAWPPG